MATKIFINLPVKDVDKTAGFFTALGFSFDDRFSDENAKCMVVNDDSSVMFLAEPFFKGFTKKEVADANRTTEAILCLSAESRQGVDEMADKALASGGRPAGDPMDQGFMYGRSFHDLDGHLWEVVHMDPGAMEGQEA